MLNKKIFQILSKTVDIALMSILGIVLITVTLMLIPSVQNRVAKIVSNRISEQKNINFSLGNFSFTKLNTITIDSLHTSDLSGNTLIDVGKIVVVVDRINLKKMEFTFKSVSLDNTYMNHIKYSGHKFSNLIELFSSNNIDTVKVEKPAKSNPRKIGIFVNYFEAFNINYKYKDMDEPETPLSINFKDIDAFDTYVKAKDIAVIGDSISLTLLHINLKEKTGFNPQIDYADVIVDKKVISVQNLMAKTPTSDFNIDLKLITHNFKSYSTFTDSVIIDGHIKKNSIVDITDVAQFTSSLAGADNIVKIQANVYGVVNDLDISNLRLNIGDSTFINADLHLKDTESPDILLDVNILNLQTNANDIENFYIPAFEQGICAPYTLSLPEEVHQLGNLNAKAKFKGKISDFFTDINITTDEGEAAAQILFEPIANSKDNSFKINLNGKKLNIGKILKLYPTISTFDATLALDGTSEKFKPKTYNINGELDNIKLEHITLNNLDVTVADNAEEFMANINIFNENIFLEASLSHFYNSSPYITNLSVKAQQTNLSKLGIFPYEDDVNTSFYINSNIIGKNIDSLNMDTYISGFNISNANITIPEQNLTISQVFDSINNTKTISLTSEGIEMHLDGNFLYSDIPLVINNISSLFTNKNSNKNNNPAANEISNLHLELKINDKFQMSKLFVPNLSINNYAHLNLNVFNENKLAVNLNTNNLLYSDLTIDNISLNAIYETDSINTIIDIDNAYFNDKKLESIIHFTNATGNISFHSDTAITKFAWTDTVNNNHGKISLLADLSKRPTMRFTIPDSIYMLYLNDLWTITTDDFIEFNDTLISVDNFAIKTGTTSLTVDGDYSNYSKEPLTANFNGLDLNSLGFLMPENFTPIGIVNGKVELSKNNDKPLIIANVNVDKIGFNDLIVGDLNINSSWNDINRKVILHTNLNDIDNNDTLINIKGDYYPYNENAINGNIKMNNIDLAMIDNFTKNIISKPRGTISGNIDISNNTSAPITKGKINIDDAGFTINFTNTSHTFSNTIDLEQDAIILNNFKIYDAYNNSFDVSGEIKHHNWKDYNLDIKTRLDNFNILDNANSFSNVVHGKTILSGNIDVEGGLEDLDLSANLRTNPGTDVTLELTSSKTASEKSFVNFISNDTASLDNAKAKTQTAMSINAKASINENTRINIVLPYGMGEMAVSGSGDISYTQEKNGNYDMSGDYTVNSGEFRLNFQNLLRRNFTISNGGTIIFNGDPMNATLDLQAVYQVRASLQGIPTITDPSLAQQRVLVNCIINFSGSLYDPVISFGLETPNIDDEIKSILFSAIDINDQTAVSQQVFSLLIMRSFSFSTDNTALGAGIGANSLGIISGQLSQWVSQIYNGFDMGVNYNPGNEISPEEFEVYVKTNFFDDRLIIDGNFGVQNKSEVTSDNNSNIIGDVQIEYKITKNGKFRVRAFNRTNQYSIIENNSPYTQGLGLSYSTEFDKFSDLFRKKKKGIIR